MGVRRTPIYHRMSFTPTEMLLSASHSLGTDLVVPPLDGVCTPVIFEIFQIMCERKIRAV